jgi:hypothetical protein
MKFLHPHWFWAILVLVPIFIGILWDERQRKARFTRFAAEATWKALAPEVDFGARIRKLFLWSLAMVFAIIALTRPQWGTHQETAKVSGMDVMFVLDISNSMEVEDVIPSRIKKSKHLIKSMADRIQGDRVGLVTFAASAAVSCPLTTDSSYMLGVMDLMTPAMAATQGTDIGLGLETARRSMDRGAEEAPAAAGAQASHAIVLISDGEDWEDAAIDAARKIRESGMKLYVFGVGTQKGGPIPDRDENGNLTTYKKDRKGDPIVSTFHPDTLMQIASAGGGRYWNASDNEAEVDEWLQDVAGMSRSEFDERTYVVFEDRFQYPLFIAVMLMLIEMMMPARKIIAGEKRSTLRVLFWMIPFLGAGLMMTHSNAQAEPLNAYIDNEKGIKDLQDGKVDEAKKEFGNAQAVIPDSPELLFNQGVVQLQGGDADSAIQSFEGAAQKSLGKNPKLLGKSLYNLGEAQTKKGDFKGAVQSYLGAIQQGQLNKDPQLEAQSRKNLELLAQEKQKQKQQQKQDQQKQQQQQQQNKDQQKQDQSSSGNQKQDQKEQPKDQKDQKDKDQKSDQKKDDKKDEKKDQPEQYKENQKQGFSSQKLSPEDADRVMDELRHQERELEAKLRKKNAQTQTSSHDW